MFQEQQKNMSNDLYKKLPIFNFSKEILRNQVKKKMRCVILGNFGAMNIGDDSILEGELKELNKIPGLTTTIVARFPTEIEKKYKLDSIQFYSFLKIIRELFRADFVIIGGGGIVCKNKRSVVDFIYQLYMLFIFFFVPMVLKKKIYALGIGIYENAGFFSLFLSSLFLRKVDILTVRDFYSQDFLSKKNIPSKLYKDNSFLMDLISEEEVLKDGFFTNKFDKKRKNIGIALIRPEDKQNEKKLLSALTEFIKKNQKDSTFWFYICSYHSSYSNDIIVNNLLLEKVKEISNDAKIFFIPTDWSAKKFFSSFKLMDFMITMRLHASIFAYRTGVPFIGISYDIKCTSFLSSMGKSSLETREITFEKIQDEFKKKNI
jgi:polysaccharide pyruvyl transferase WcaK-like protein